MFSDYGLNFCFQVMQKSCRCAFMYGELTDKETIARIDEILENQYQDQFEILLYKKNSKSIIFYNSYPMSVCWEETVKTSITRHHNSYGRAIPYAWCEMDRKKGLSSLLPFAYKRLVTFGISCGSNLLAFSVYSGTISCIFSYSCSSHMSRAWIVIQWVQEGCTGCGAKHILESCNSIITLI